MSDQGAEITASQKRAAHPDFVKTFSWHAIRDRLPLRFLVPDDTPPSPKRHYRSHYRYLGHDDLHQPAILAQATLFEIASNLRLAASSTSPPCETIWLSSATGAVPKARSPLTPCLCSCAFVCAGNWTVVGPG